MTMTAAQTRLVATVHMALSVGLAVAGLMFHVI